MTTTTDDLRSLLDAERADLLDDAYRPVLPAPVIAGQRDVRARFQTRQALLAALREREGDRCGI